MNNFTLATFETKHRFSCKQYCYLITWHCKKYIF